MTAGTTTISRSPRAAEPGRPCWQGVASPTVARRSCRCARRRSRRCFAPTSGAPRRASCTETCQATAETTWTRCWRTPRHKGPENAHHGYSEPFHARATSELALCGDRNRRGPRRHRRGFTGVARACRRGGGRRTGAAADRRGPEPDRAPLAAHAPARLLARRSDPTSAISAIDQALWDIKGKRLGVPVYDLLGGPTRRRVRLYTHVVAARLRPPPSTPGRWSPRALRR